MTTCKITQLTERGVVRIKGADAHRLLQDIVTSNIARARDGKAVHAALLMPQGKILFDFFLLDRGSDLLLETNRSSIPELIKRLTFYKLRADVTIEDASVDYSVWASWGGSPNVSGEMIVYADPRLADMGHRLLAAAGHKPETGCEVATVDDYHAHRIGLGIPESGLDYPLGDTFPHEADYDQTGSVDFKKGCYVGQEVVGRMQHRGKARKRIVQVNAAAPLTAGAEITAGESSIGAVGSVSGKRGLAMVRLDRAEKALQSGNSLMAGDIPINLHKPAWAAFDVPSAEQRQ